MRKVIAATVSVLIMAPSALSASGIPVVDAANLAQALQQVTQLQQLIKTKENEYLIYVDVWIPPILDKIQNQSVKKTLTIPFWLNEEAEKYKVNFSLLLQTALKEYLGIK